MLLIVLFFGTPEGSFMTQRDQAQLLIDIWDIKHRLAATGLFLESESSHEVAQWKPWAVVSAKRRTILALHHLEWTWSIRNKYPTMPCFELGPLPAPAPSYLWAERDERRWQEAYRRWLRVWEEGGGYRMIEFFHIDSDKGLDVRTESWLAEADEFGMMLMAEGESPNSNDYKRRLF